MQSRNALSLVIITLAIASLSACANMNQAQCEAANWQAIGYEDGVAGVQDSRFSQHRQECAEHGITANIDDYLEGHSEGSEKYCTKTNGFFLGTKGQNYNRNCPEALAPIFLSGLSDGKRVYSAKKSMNARQNALDTLYARIENLEELIAENKELLIADGLVRSERLDIRQQNEELEINLIRLIDLIPEHQEDHALSIESYEQVKSEFAEYY